MKLEVITTEDGSHSIFSKELNESYHSKFGAINESMVVFIDAGFNQLLHRKRLNILEIGFGTGLNALLTFNLALENRIEVNYYTIEPFPVPPEIYIRLNFPELLNMKEADGRFRELHEIKWNKQHKISDYFFITKLNLKLEDVKLNQEFFDLVYYDAFSPEVQPQLWTLAVFEKIYNSMNRGGILTTYSAKGSVRRNLIQAGFRAERIPGPKGKREITRAVKT
jgi:tRNA U34 5-methylaminomethyl-2-thiouridine-forming methyltransferase MnmC